MFLFTRKRPKIDRKRFEYSIWMQRMFQLTCATKYGNCNSTHQTLRRDALLLTTDRFQLLRSWFCSQHINVAVCLSFQNMWHSNWKWIESSSHWKFAVCALLPARYERVQKWMECYECSLRTGRTFNEGAVVSSRFSPWINKSLQLHAICRIVDSEHVTSNLFQIIQNKIFKSGSVYFTVFQHSTVEF